MNCYINTVDTPAGHVYVFRDSNNGPVKSMSSVSPQDRTEVIEAAAAEFDPERLPGGTLVGEFEHDGSEITEVTLYDEPLH